MSYRFHDGFLGSPASGKTLWITLRVSLFCFSPDRIEESVTSRREKVTHVVNINQVDADSNNAGQWPISNVVCSSWAGHKGSHHVPSAVSAASSGKISITRSRGRALWLG